VLDAAIGIRYQVVGRRIARTGICPRTVRTSLASRGSHPEKVDSVQLAGLGQLRVRAPRGVRDEETSFFQEKRPGSGARCLWRVSGETRFWILIIQKTRFRSRPHPGRDPGFPRRGTCVTYRGPAARVTESPLKVAGLTRGHKRLFRCASWTLSSSGSPRDPRSIKFELELEARSLDDFGTIPEGS